METRAKPTTPASAAEWVEFAKGAVEEQARVQKGRDAENARLQAEIDRYIIFNDQRTRALGYVIGKDGLIHLLGDAQRTLARNPGLRRLIEAHTKFVLSGGILLR